MSAFSLPSFQNQAALPMWVCHFLELLIARFWLGSKGSQQEAILFLRSPEKPKVHSGTSHCGAPNPGSPKARPKKATQSSPVSRRPPNPHVFPYSKAGGRNPKAPKHRGVRQSGRWHLGCRARGAAALGPGPRAARGTEGVRWARGEVAAKLGESVAFFGGTVFLFFPRFFPFFFLVFNKQGHWESFGFRGFCAG